MGLVGVGGWGMTNATSIMRSHRFDILGITDIEKERSMRFAKRFNTGFYDSYEEMLNDQKISAVALTVPNMFHPEMVRQAADAGKHIFIEKPLASSAENCRILGQYCDEKKIILSVGYQTRREPGIRMIEEIIRTQTFGKPLFARGLRTIRRIHTDWRFNPTFCQGGAMEQLGSHLIDVMIYLFGPVRKSSGWGRNIPHRHDGPDWGHVELQFDSGMLATVDSSFSCPNKFQFDVFFEHACLHYDGRKLIQTFDNKIKTFSFSSPKGNIEQFHEFTDCIEGAKCPETDWETSARIMEVISSMQPR
jgi:predicted dehydrogenase